MHLKIYGDLHLEFDRERPLRLTAPHAPDVVILAGDIANGTDGIRWAQSCFPDAPVIYVLGNHEFYGHDFDQLIEQARDCAQGTNVHLLENDFIDIKGVRFLGCSLWTDFCLFGAESVGRAIEEASTGMADYRVIRRLGRRLRPQDTAERFDDSKVWLDQQISASPLPIVVVTHHAPTYAVPHPQYLNGILNAAFYSNLEFCFRPPVKMWIHGHTHYNCDLEIDGVRLISHQHGYPHEKVYGFRPDGDFILEIPS